MEDDPREGQFGQAEALSGLPGTGRGGSRSESRNGEPRRHPATDEYLSPGKAGRVEGDLALIQITADATRTTT